MFVDALTLDAQRRTRDGYLAVRARASRTGTYRYLGSEIDPDNKHGLRDAGLVNVLRDEATVFDEAAARSFIGKPVTDDHPSAPVNADNWRDHARGMVMGAMRDGEYLAFDLLLTDAAAIEKIDDGKRELSNGYSADLEFGDFQASDGTKCVARQKSIAGNHVALVDKGRAGSECAIVDAASCASLPIDLMDKLLNDSVAKAIDWLKAAIALHEKHMNGTAPTTGKAGEKSQQLMMTQMEKALAELGGSTMKMADGGTYNDGSLDGNNRSERREASSSQIGSAARQDGEVRMPHTLMIDGLQVPNVSDEAKAAIEKLQGQVTTLTADKATADTQVATLTTEKATLDAKVATLEQQVKDAKLTPAQLRDAAKSYAQVVGKAKALGVEVKDDMAEPAIMRAAVTANLGDTAKDWNDAQVAASFASLTKDATGNRPDALRSTIASQPLAVADAAAVRNLARMAQY